VLSGVFFASPMARASNAAAPRVPPSFLDATCMLQVHKADDPLVHFQTGIPFQDTERTADELPDSRTLQFFALCRGPDAMQPMPAWIDADDIARAAALDPAVGTPAASDVLATALPFAGPGHDGTPGSCIVPIVATDERIPITCEATQQGVLWDTTNVPPGAYAVWGYTFEPVASLWTPRPGVVRIVEGTAGGEGEASAGPAVAWSWPSTSVTAGLSAGVTLTGCAAAAPGTTVAIHWATAVELQRDPAAAWVVLDEIALPDGGELSIPFLPPPELLYEAVFVRAVATDPEGRTFTAITRAPIVFRPGCEAPEGGTVVLADACGVSDVSPASPAARDAGGCEDPDPVEDPDPAEDPDPVEDPDASDGEAGCRTAGNPAPTALLACLALAVGIRRWRRQSPTRRTSVRSCASSPRSDTTRRSIRDARNSRNASTISVQSSVTPVSHESVPRTISRRST
jgi:hypothetical protein